MDAMRSRMAETAARALESAKTRAATVDLSNVQAAVESAKQRAAAVDLTALKASAASQTAKLRLAADSLAEGAAPLFGRSTSATSLAADEEMSSSSRPWAV